jgi:DNA-binding CsgD family transcriptional regulator/tetratricopeptide (TPR) repeat protein
VVPPANRRENPRCRRPARRDVPEDGVVAGPEVHTGLVPGVSCPITVGRDRELRVLGDLLDAALEGRGGLLFVTGEPGIGKSRLVRELVQVARSRGAVTAVGRAVPGGGTPYRPLTEALLQLLRDRELPTDVARSPWARHLAGVLPTWASGRGAGSSAPARAEAVLRLVGELARPGGGCVILEDLHWSDADTLAVVDYLADNAEGQPVLWVVTCRDLAAQAAGGTMARIVARRSAGHLGLARLGRAEVERMVTACLPGVSDDVLTRVHRSADGIPFLVEEVLASPGMPRTFQDTVRLRLAEFPEEERQVIEAAAVLGRRFDWSLLPGITGAPPGVVDRALERAIGCWLLEDDPAEPVFRHALTREAVLRSLPPHRRRMLASTALAVVDGPPLDGPLRDLAADLALMAGERQRAALLFLAAGTASADQGALATAAEALQRAHRLGSHEAGPRLVEILALAGRVDEATAVGAEVAARLEGSGPVAQLHLCLAQAAVAAARWQLAEDHLRRAAAECVDGVGSPLGAVLAAEIALAADDLPRAREEAERALAMRPGPQVQCQALEVLGRVERLSDPARGRERFAAALAVAEEAGLSVWRLRALHELGTIDMFEHAGRDRLEEARQAAVALGAVATAAELDLQLVAVGHTRFDLDSAATRARSALAAGERLRLARIRAKALYCLAENSALRGDRLQMEHHADRTTDAAGGDTALLAFTEGGCRGMWHLLHGDRDSSVVHLRRAAAMLAGVPHAEPACFRALWPVVLTSLGDPGAGTAIDEARRLGVAALSVNDGLLGLAAAALAGRDGNQIRARRTAEAAFLRCTNGETWADMARVLIAESARSEGWDEPGWWLRGAADRLAAHGLGRLAQRARELDGGVGRWAGLGITAREGDVLDLVMEGLPNKEIAARLFLSHRTVEKHVEALLRKLHARSRTQLVTLAEAARRSVAVQGDTYRPARRPVTASRPIT